MATQVIATSPAHFTPGQDEYSPSLYSQYAGYQNYTPIQGSHYLYNATQSAPGFTLPDSWGHSPHGTHGVRRVSSRSPNVNQDRTPIRHHKPNTPRSRSTSRPDALLAYATEQSMQQASHQHPMPRTPSLAPTPPTTTTMIFPAQSYHTPPLASPYMQQPQFYTPAPQQYQDLSRQTSSQPHTMHSFYPPSRPDLQVSTMPGPSLQSSDAPYIQELPPAPHTSTPKALATAMGYTPSNRTLESMSANIEITANRNRPQCWEHGCNGRPFSTFSNLLRHQREKSGTASKARCPHCGTEFTRTTARNGHMYGGKCKGLQDSEQPNPVPAEDET